MAAVQAVLGTTELLENIIVQLTPANIHKVKRVCNHWHQLVCNSKRLRLAGNLMPIGPSTDEVDQKDGMAEVIETIYDVATEIQIHPVFGSAINSRLESLVGTEYERCITEYDREHMKKYAAAFATMPPCRIIGMRTIRDQRPWKPVTGCMIYIKDGIRVGDLMQVSGILCHQDGLHLLNSVDAIYVFVQ